MFQLYDIQGPVKAISEPTAVTVGVFDGVHVGHQALIKQLSSLHPQLAPLVVTLTAHPSYVLGRHPSEYWLDDPDEHLRLLFEAGAKYVAVLPFTPEVAQLSACQMARLMYDELYMRHLLLGYDSRFGSKQNDDFDQLSLLAARMGFPLQRGESYLADAAPISSSRIRESLSSGSVSQTASLLGRPYSITGTVLHGRGVGHTLGFPTANIDLSQTRKMLPKEGVYAVWACGHEGVANLGPTPTFGINTPSLEVHIADFNSDLYGQTVCVEFRHRLRDIMRFDSSEALQRQMQADIKQARCQW